MKSTSKPFSLSSIKVYRRIERQAVADLTRLRDISHQIGLSANLIKLIDDILARNKDNKFSIAVVGEFKRGKSTFINALLGTNVLPSDVEPCSATLNRVTYGVTPLVKIIFKGENEQPERQVQISIDQLTDYVTKLTPESEKRAASIKEAIVHYPIGYCRNNVDIIDTPGLNDNESMTEVTLSVLPQVSAAIFIIIPQAPFAGSEGDFLNNKLLLSDMGRVLFVVNRIDDIRSNDDRERVIKSIKNRIKDSMEKRLRQQFGINTEKYWLYHKRIGEPKVFGLSSLEALEGKLNHDKARLENSGFPEFEVALEKLLTQTRGALELQMLANRSVSASDEIVKKLKIEMGALQMAPEEFEQSYQKASVELEALRTRRKQEWRNINEATEKTQQKVRPMLTELENTLKSAAHYAIEQTAVEPSELGDEESLQKKVGQEVSQAIDNAGQKVSERIQLQIERDLEIEANRLHDFANTVSENLHQIELQFAEVDSTFKENGNSGDALAFVVGGVTGTLWGGVLSGYNEAGGKGAAVGGAAGLGTFMAGFALLGALSLPFTLPAAVAMGIASTFTGKWLTRKVFAGERVKRFKQNYEQLVLQKLDEKLREQRLDIQVNESIVTAYRTLKEQIVGEVNGLIEETQKTLDEIREKKARHETATEHQRQEFKKMQAEVERIRHNAFQLSKQLVEITG